MARRFLRAALVPLGFATLLHAAPMLRLVNSAVVPVPLPVGANGGTQIVEAYNAGDGSLSLSNPASSVSWIATSFAPSRACTTTTASSTCIPLQLALNTSTLAAGTYTASVTVNCAADVVDAPQTITVTVRIGALSVYVAPGSTSDVSFSTNSPLAGVATTQDGNRWLSLTVNGAGSFRFTYPYNVHVAPPASMAQGTYNGSLVTSGSSFAPDNQTIPVTMHLTTQPIAQASPSQVTERLAQGAAPLAMQISLNNPGQRSLTIGAVSSTTTDGGTWLTASANSGGWAAITLDPGTLAPGFYTGSVSIASNAVNGTVGVPVSFQVVAKGAPLANYMGVVDNAIFGSGDAVAPGDIVDVFGEQFWFASPIAFSPSVPLDTDITASGSSSSVLVNGSAAPLYFTSYYQIAFQVPLETPVGTALVQVQRDGISGNTVSVQVAGRAPRLLLAGGTSFGAIQNAEDLSYPAPVGYFGPGATSHPAQVGDVLTIYAIGLGPTNPAVGTNVPAPGAEPLARLTTCPASPPCLAPIVEFGSGIFGTFAATPSYAGLSPGSVGLYQVNVTIPAGVPSGTVDVALLFPDSLSNTVQIAVQ
jgi:uncharacterized protein (TIGR03437 family)